MLNFFSETMLKIEGLASVKCGDPADLKVLSDLKASSHSDQSIRLKIILSDMKPHY